MFTAPMYLNILSYKPKLGHRMFTASKTYFGALIVEYHIIYKLQNDFLQQVAVFLKPYHVL